MSTAGAIFGIVLGVALILVLGFFGWDSGFKKWSDSPETKEWIERQRKERERQEEWKRKVGKK